jgi:short subunit dehydrogenase-like uncharacterized protein
MARNWEFDIVIWGASGFTGRRVAHHMAARYGSGGGDLRWAIGGRNQAKLESVRSELGSAGTDIPIVTGDSHDVASLEALAARTKVVCSTVGPYAKYGSELVKACVSTGTHYCDETGEAHWIRKMIDAHQAEAEKTGARIVHACGFDSIPSDMGVFFLQHKAKERHGIPCSHIKMRIEAMRGGFSGGTLATLIDMQKGARDPSIRRVMTEPYSLNPEGQRQGPDRPQSMSAVTVKYDEDLKGWTMPWFMTPLNTKVVRRSNALLGYPYSEDFRYDEAILVGSGPVGWVIATIAALGVGGFMQALALPPTRWLLKKFVLPKPGQGPSQRVRERGFFDIVLVGKLGEGNVMRARVKGVGDPGVESTSKLLVESALCLAQDSDRIAVGGGIWTPASAMGELLLSRLTSDAGFSFELD